MIPDMNEFRGWTYHGPAAPPDSLGFFIGAAVRQHQTSALAVVEKVSQRSMFPPGATCSYALRHVERVAPGKTAYAEVVRRAEVLAADRHSAALAVDITDVGLPLAGLFREAHGFDSMTFTVLAPGRTLPTFDSAHGVWCLSPKILVDVLDAALRAGYFRIADKLPDAEALVRELAMLPGAVAGERWPDGGNADLTLAAALALWLAERQDDGGGDEELPIAVGGRLSQEGMPRGGAPWMENLNRRPL